MRTGGSQIGEAQALAFLARPAPFDLNLYASQPEAAAEIRYFAETPGASALGGIDAELFAIAAIVAVVMFRPQPRHIHDVGTRNNG